eukprot:CAMPEP_0172606472 /NCGR_PEP_ID=MMETSP1068-20121228/26673_1 /TAXON_ID=35684 /ORGANISM="Pseudopedinella elastica, Strain CCMP716" /LENGTH=90 /DNA_ID=CAMNT_0013409181 /DNA_START=1109 /DNA_END=1381 /DNA_ORIENTATION=+
MAQGSTSDKLGPAEQCGGPWIPAGGKNSPSLEGTDGRRLPLVPGDTAARTSSPTSSTAAASMKGRNEARGTAGGELFEAATRKDVKPKPK